MDPRLKMQYYKDKKWERVYITAAKRAITQLWESTYKGTSSNIQASENENDDFLAHVFKKRRSECKNEFITYLKELIVPSKTNILLS